MGNANICVANDIRACISVSVCPHLLKEQFSLKSKLNKKKCLQKYKEFSLVSVLFYLGHELKKQKKKNQLYLLLRSVVVNPQGSCTTKDNTNALVISTIHLARIFTVF